MRQNLLVLGVSVVGAVGAIAPPDALAEVEPEMKVQSKQIIKYTPSMNEVEQPLTTTKGLLVQQPAPTTAQITGVQLKPTDTGLEVILETAAEFPEVLNSETENSLITDIPNAQLRLPKGGAFRRDNPTPNIASVEVINLDATTLRVTVTSKAGVPAAEVSQSPQALILSVIAPPVPAAQPTPAPTAPPPTAPAPEPQTKQEERLELTVTAEEEAGGYIVPDTTTATKTDTPIRDIPASIQVIPKQVLEDQQAIRLDEAVRNVSSVVQDGGFGGTTNQLNIRGFFVNEILRDGFKDNTGGFSETANLERIEVLKGPASVLFGNLEPGGVINLVTEKPLSEPFYSGELSAGSFGFIRPQIDLSGPLNSDGSLLYRMNGVYEHSGSFRTPSTVDINRFFIAPVLIWKLSKATDLTVEFDYLNDERPMDRGLVAIGTEVADIPISRRLGEPGDVRQVEELGAGYQLEHRFSEDWRLRNAFRFLSSDDFDYRAEPVELDETTGILTRNFRSNDDLSRSYALQTNLVGEFATGPIEHTLLFGIDLARATSGGTQRRLPEPEDPDEAGGTPPIDIFDPVYNQISRPALADLTNVVRDDSNRTDLLGIYLQDQISLADNLKFLLGGRFDIVDQESIDNLEATTTTQYDSAFSPRVGLVYQPIEPISLYASYSRSFNPNFATSEDGSFLEPERGTQYEVGVKTELLDGRLSSTLAFYDLTKTNIGTTDPTNSDNLLPVGTIKSQGIELDVIGEILPGWNVIASYGYIDSRVTESSDPENFPVGLRTANVPFNTASLWTTYEIQRGDLQGLGFGAGLFYVGERQGDFENTFVLPGYLRTDAVIYYRRNNWKVALNIKNLFNSRYFESVNFGRVAIEPGAPFTVLGTVSAEF